MESAENSGMIRLWFGYDPELGVLTRKLKERSDAPDTINPERLTVQFKGRCYRYSTLVWVVYYGEFPSGWIDHKNRIKTDNRIDNLRIATPTQNQQNKAGTGTYMKGVTWRNRIMKPWQAKIRVNGVRLHLGSFATQKEAGEAYIEACLKYHGEFACPK